MQNRNRLRQRIASRRAANSEWVEAVQRACFCTKNPSKEESAMSVQAEVKLTSPNVKPILEKTLTVSDCGKTFDFADFESQYSQDDENKDSLRNLYSVCFLRPPLRSSTIEISLIGTDGFKKQRLGCVKCNLEEIFGDHDELQDSGEPEQIGKDNTAWMGSNDHYKRLSLVHAFVSKGRHISQFAGSVKCRFSLTQNNMIVNFIDARELRNMNVPVDLAGLDTIFVTVSLTMLFMYFVIGIIVYSYVPMSFISAATTERCINDTGSWKIVETGVSTEWESPSLGRVVSAFYFCVVIFTSVGFGDLITIPSGLRVFTLIFVLWGAVTLGFMLHLGSWVQEYIVFKVVKLKRRCTRKKSAVIVAEEGIVDSQKPELIPDRKQLLCGEVIAALAMFFLTVLLGMFIYTLDKLVFQAPNPSMSSGEVFVNMLYFSIITCTTIGFGDETPDTTGGKFLNGIFLLVALPVFGNAITVLASLPTTRRKLRAEKKVLTQFGRHLSGEEVRSLIHAAGDKGESCTRAQFVLHMLLKQAKVSPSNVMYIGKVFDGLDDDESGFLDINDVDEDPDRAE